MSRFLDQIKKTKEAREKAALDKTAPGKSESTSVPSVPEPAPPAILGMPSQNRSLNPAPAIAEENPLIPEYSKPDPKKQITTPNAQASDKSVSSVTALIPEITQPRKQESVAPATQTTNTEVEIKDLMAEIFSTPTTPVAQITKEELLETPISIQSPKQLTPDFEPEQIVLPQIVTPSAISEEVTPFPMVVPTLKQEDILEESVQLQADDTLPPVAPLPSLKPREKEDTPPETNDLYPSIDFEIPNVAPVAADPVVSPPAVPTVPDLPPKLKPSAVPVVIPPAVATVPEQPPKPPVSVVAPPKPPVPIIPPLEARPLKPVVVSQPEPVPQMFASIPEPEMVASKPDPEPLPTQPLFPNQLEVDKPPTNAPIPQPESPLFPNTERRDTTPGNRERHRLTPKRAKGEIPVSGPVPDPLSIQRITVVHPRPEKTVLSFYEPKHNICEEYRLLGKNLLHTFANTGEITKRGKVVTLTSSIRGEGKTLTSINLALNMAYDLKDRILLIDGDLRHPRVHKYLGLPGQTGLNDLINSVDPKAILEDCIVRTEGGLHCLFSQATRENPAPLLDTPRMSEILELLRDRYALIIIDTPPVLLATDSLVLGSRSDGVLFILRARKTKREQIQEARQRIARLEIRMLGYVINNVKTFLPKIWSRYYYGRYHY